MPQKNKGAIRSRYYNMTTPLTIVCGPTATGKTTHALKLAQEQGGELISADSRQVYKYLDIGTGKDVERNSKFKIQNSKLHGTNNKYDVGYYEIDRTPVWLYDVITPDQNFSAHSYAQVAHIVIADIRSRGKTPILVGGTGLYINAVVDGFETISPPDWELRKTLENYSVQKLQSLLMKQNTKRFSNMNHSDKHNPRRLIRAIEIERSKKQGDNEPVYRRVGNKTKIQYDARFIGLKIPIKELGSRIEKRVEKRIEQGMLDEITSVLNKGYSWDDPGLNTLGYKQLRPYFEKQKPLDVCVEKWKIAERQYARRQITWFKKNPRIQWIES